MQCKSMSKKVIALVMVGVMAASTTTFASVVNKDETVYVSLDENGKAVDTTVSTWLNSDKPLSEVKDKSSLKDIKNVKGEEEPKAEDGFVVWNSNKNDLYYNGKSDKSLPISVNIKYELDGKEVNPKDILGKSGKLKFTIDIKNNEKRTINVNGKSREAYVPFTVAGSMVLPKDNFSNLKLDGAKLLDDGTKQVVGFAALPGLKESLDIKDFNKIKDTIVVECDTENFELASIMLVATPEIPQISDLKDVDKVDDVLDAIDKLDDAGNKLLEGATKLLDGQNTFNKNMVTFNDGVGKIKNGFGELYSGVNLIKGKYSSLLGEAPKLINGVNDLNNGLRAYNNNFDMFLNKFSSASNGASKVYGGLKLSQAQVKQLRDGKNKENEGIKQLAQKVGELDKGIAGLKAIGNTIQDPKTKAQLIGLANSLEGLKPALTQLGQSSEMITSGLNTVYNKFYEADDSLLNGVGSLDEGLKALNAAGVKLSNEGSKKLQNGSEALAKGVNSLGGTNNEDVSKKLDSFINGVESLNTGINTLSEGSNKLLEGSNKLMDGTKELKDGASKLKTEGIDKLSKEGKEKVGDIKDLVKVKDELINLSKTYNSYSGISEGMNGKVKFVMKTEELKKEKKVEEKKVEEKKEKKGFIQWIKSLFDKE